MSNSAFRDPDEGLDLDEQVKLISMTLQVLRERPAHQQQRMSDCGSQPLPVMRTEAAPAQVAQPTEQKMEEEQVRSEPPDSQHIRVESSPVICPVKRPNHEELDDVPSKRMKHELLPPQKQVNSRSIGYLQLEALPEQAEHPNDLLLDSEENHSHKLHYQQLCRAYESKTMEIEGLIESNRVLDERTVEMELRLLKEKVATRKLIRGFTEELWRYERLEQLEQSNSFVNGERNKSLDQYVQELQTAISELRTKKVRRAKSIKQPKEPVIEPTSNILDYYDKDKMGFAVDLAKKLENELNQLQRERSRARQSHEYQEKLLKTATILRPNEQDCLLLFDRLAVKKYLFTIDEEEYYECFDFESLSTLQLKITSSEQPDPQKRLEDLKMLKSVVDRTMEISQVSLLRNISTYIHGDSHLIILRELFRSSSLRELSNKYDGLSETMMKHIVKVVAAAMLHVKSKLGTQDIAHPNNILLDKSANSLNSADIRLADYGLSYQSQTKYADLRRFYYPPEFWRSDTAQKLATWSLAVTFYECFYGKRPFNYEADDLKGFEFHEQVNFPPKPALSELAKGLIRQCLIASASLRIDLPTFLKHEYFNQK